MHCGVDKIKSVSHTLELKSYISYHLYISNYPLVKIHSIVSSEHQIGTPRSQLSNPLEFMIFAHQPKYTWLIVFLFSSSPTTFKSTPPPWFTASWLHSCSHYVLLDRWKCFLLLQLHPNSLFLKDLINSH